MNSARSERYVRHDFSARVFFADTGFTLLELLIVITIMALAAAAVLPGISASNQAQVDLVAEKLAAALRFARSEAMRTNIAHGIIVDHNDTEATGKDIVVYQVDTSGSPFGIGPVVYQPVAKVPYDIFLIDAKESASSVLLNSAPAFTFDSEGASQHLHFTPAGRPVLYVEGIAHRLLDGTIRVGEGSYERTVTVSSLNGQVVVHE